MGLLSWLGRRKSRALGFALLIGILIPPVGAALKPFIGEAVFALLCIAFLRVDPAALRQHIARPLKIILATLWTSVAIPVLVILTSRVFGIHAAHPDLYLGLMLQALASPMMATPAIAAIMGLDATLVLAVLICSTLLTPLSASVLASIIDLNLSISAFKLGVKLLFILAASAAVGFIARRIIGAQKIAANQDRIDGMNILILFVFVAAVLSELGGQILTSPLLVFSITVLAFLVFLVLFGLTTLVFRSIGHRNALALAVMTAQRNMGLMIATTGSAVPELTWLYFAVSQFPIYLAPQISRLFIDPESRLRGS